MSVSHSFSQISYVFEPLESTECLHSQDTMSIRGTILVKYVLKVRVEVSQYLTLSVKYPISLNRWSQLSVFTLTMSIRGTMLVQYVSSRFESEVSQYLTLSVKYPISLNRWSQLSVFTLKIQCPFEVQYWSKYVPELESEVSQYLTLSVKYPISLNRWSQLSVFTLKIQCPFEVQYWSKYVLQVRVRSVSVSHSFSQISYLFEPLESTECLHSQDTMSIRGTILVQVCSKLESEVSQYLTLSVK